MIDKTKRFWCFGYDNYYPKGGMNDCIYSNNSYEECVRWYEESSKIYDNFDIIDTEEEDSYKESW